MSKLAKDTFSELIQNFALPALFNTLGWDNFNAAHKIEIKGECYDITGIAQKKDFSVLECVVEDSQFPPAAVRKQFEKPVSKLYHDHLLVFTNKNKTQQHWQLPLREEGKLKRLVTFSWHKGQVAEALYQKFRNIVFTLDEEENITLLDVKERVNAGLAANSEKVTKKFYAEFTKQHDAFLAFIKGIDDAISDKENFNKKWYASLMLNRLMFCYFIQKKLFLNWNGNYLQDKLKECKKLKGQNNFYGFYRSFLLELFHDELANPEEKRKKNKTPIAFGSIPYLNGGLFESHYLEDTYKKIAIEDEAFQNIFDFFDEWNWHLDTRITASGKDINPDVIGYIFEKYINNRADMGAYYTKEDITGYIGKNTVIPFLLEKVKTWYPAPFEPGGGFWQYLQDSGDEYLYDSVKHGAEGKSAIDELDIPKNIKTGIDATKPHLLERRKDWNTSAPQEIALPTEIWRETIARLQRYFELKQKIVKGKINNINDLITYNLNIQRLVQDYMEQTADKEFIRKFYKALLSITILDPTCGSGAFLFAALNILEPLYETCIQRMEEFYNANPKGNKDFADRLLPLFKDEHPSRSYYIYKTIILNNLYGVDLMKEAVEIAKLRLFLKLVAEVDPSRRKPNYGLEPLPDIDFNIRSGNTLVGFATEQQLEEVVRETEGDLIYKEKLAELTDKSHSAGLFFDRFQREQTSGNINSISYKQAKKQLSAELRALNEILNLYLARTYGINPDASKHKDGKKEFAAWKESHQPFHWFAEFYEIISRGGFDVVIGNPPYVEMRNEKYKVKNYFTENCGNLYALCYERAILLSNNKAFVGFIIPVASVCTDSYSELQKLWMHHGALYISCYNDRPGKLFDGLEHIRLSIVLLEKGKQPKTVNSTKYNKWNTIYRDFLFENLMIIDVNSLKKYTLIPKIGNHISSSILKKTNNNTNNLSKYLIKNSQHKIYYTRKLSGFVQILDFIPEIKENGGKIRQPSELKELFFENKEQAHTYLAILNSSFFYWNLTVWSDCRNLNQREIQNLPFDISTAIPDNIAKLNELTSLLMEDIKNHSLIKEMSFKNVGILSIQCIYPKKSKPIIDEIDKVLAKHYGFTEEELDFIINYDIKYRMGGELEKEP